MSVQLKQYIKPVVVALALLLIAAVFRGESPYSAGYHSRKEPPPIVVALEDAYLVGMHRGSKRWALRAQRVEISRSRSTTILSGISSGQVFDKGKVILHINAGRAIYNERTEGLKLSRGIQAVSTDGQQITTQTAYWNSRASLLSGVGHVRMRSRWGTIDAQDMRADMRKKEAVLRNVSFRINIGELERKRERT